MLAPTRVFGSLIVAVADYVDRHRRRGEREERIRRQLSDQSATRFDPAFVQAMLEIMQKNCLAVKCGKAVFCQDS